MIATSFYNHYFINNLFKLPTKNSKPASGQNSIYNNILILEIIPLLRTCSGCKRPEGEVTGRRKTRAKLKSRRESCRTLTGEACTTTLPGNIPIDASVQLKAAFQGTWPHFWVYSLFDILLLFLYFLLSEGITLLFIHFSYS